MTDRYRALARVRNPVLFMSTVAWILILAGHGTFAHCPVAASGPVPFRASFQTLLAMNPPAALSAGWVLMLVAMMSPTLIPPILHVRMQSFANRRLRSIGLFLAGYAVLWMMLGGPILTIVLAIRVFAQQSNLPAVAAILVAMAWQFSPIKQRCLNRCHTHFALAAFGTAADIDALRFGFTQGGWCIGSCWALMLFPMLLPEGHVAAMAIVTLVIISERLEQPRPLSWRWRGPGKAIRIFIAQARIHIDPSQ